MRAVQRARLWAITCTASQAFQLVQRSGSEGRWFSPTPYLRSLYRILDLGVAAVVSTIQSPGSLRPGL